MPRKHHDYTVGCICPMGVEVAPVMAMLDRIHPRLPTQHDQTYTLGDMEGHNVVIAVLPETGTNAAATVAVHLLNDFPSIRFGLLVGVGGGIPDQEEGGNDVRLGDVVVSKSISTSGGVIQYDLGKETSGGFERTGTLNKPPRVLQSAVNQLWAQHELEESKISEYLSSMIAKFPRMREKYQHPGVGQDKLFRSSYEHQGGTTCVGCEESEVIDRPRRMELTPHIHYGLIGSANRLIKHALVRDKLKQGNPNLICIEMEAAGLMDSFPCLVIRGISDYADSHKNKRWQPYAAATAAAYMRELLSVIPPRDVVKASSDGSEAQVQDDAAAAPATPPSDFEQLPIAIRQALRQDMPFNNLIEQNAYPGVTVRLPYFDQNMLSIREFEPPQMRTTTFANSGFELARILGLLPYGKNDGILKFSRVALTQLIHDSKSYFTKASTEGVLGLICDNLNSVEGDDTIQKVRTGLGTFTFSSGFMGRFVKFNSQECYDRLHARRQDLAVIRRQAAKYFQHRVNAIAFTWHRTELGDALMSMDLEQTIYVRIMTTEDARQLEHYSCASTTILNFLHKILTLKSHSFLSAAPELHDILSRITHACDPSVDVSARSWNDLIESVDSMYHGLFLVGCSKSLIEYLEGERVTQLLTRSKQLFRTLVLILENSPDDHAFRHDLCERLLEDLELCAPLASLALVVGNNATLMKSLVVVAPTAWIELLTTPDFDILLG